MTVEEMALIVSLIGIVLSAVSLGYRGGRGPKKMTASLSNVSGQLS